MMKSISAAMIAFGAFALLMGGALAVPEANASTVMQCGDTWTCNGSCFNTETFCNTELNLNCRCRKILYA